MAANRQSEIGISIRAYASLVGVDEKTVRKARDAGLLGDGFDKVTGKIYPSLADIAWGDLKKVVRPQAGISRERAIRQLTEKIDEEDYINGSRINEDEEEWLSDEEIRTGNLLNAIKVSSTLKAAEAMRRREIIALALDKKKLEEAEGILVRKDAIDKELFAIGNELKKDLMSLPQRIIDDILIAGSKVEAMNVLTKSIIQILDKISSKVG